MKFWHQVIPHSFFWDMVYIIITLQYYYATLLQLVHYNYYRHIITIYYTTIWPSISNVSETAVALLGYYFTELFYVPCVLFFLYIIWIMLPSCVSDHLVCLFLFNKFHLIWYSSCWLSFNCTEQSVIDMRNSTKTLVSIRRQLPERQ